MQRTSRPRLLVHLRMVAVLFALTGAVALLLEQAFEKMLSTLLGSSTPAAATVLGVYFAGLSLGGLAYGHLIRYRASRPLMIYAVLEGGVGLCALLMYLFFDDLIPVFVPLLALGLDHFWLLQFLRILVAICWILPLTFLMGASFPAIVDSLEAMRVPQRGRAMSRFYMINLLGGLLGVFIGLYFLFPRLGVDGALLAACGTNSVVCLTAVWLGRGMKIPPKAWDAGQNLVPPRRPALPGNARILLVVAFVSGFLFFSLEVLWTHLISAVMGNSIYAFGTMLAIVLLGLGIGAAAVTRFYPPQKAFTLADLSSLAVASAVVLMLFFSFWPRVPLFFLTIGSSAHTFFQGECVRWALALLMLLPSAIFLGMIYPALFRLDIFPAEERHGGRPAGSHKHGGMHPGCADLWLSAHPLPGVRGHHAPAHRALGAGCAGDLPGLPAWWCAPFEDNNLFGGPYGGSLAGPLEPFDADLGYTRLFYPSFCLKTIQPSLFPGGHEWRHDHGGGKSRERNNSNSPDQWQVPGK